MQSIKYMGSKKSLVDFIERSINDFFSGKDSSRTFFDVFGGSGRVAYHFRNKYQVTTCDKQLFTRVIVSAYLCNTYPQSHYVSLIDHLNNLPSEYFEQTDKWYSETYSAEYTGSSSIGEDNKPKIWQRKNAVKIDMIRHRISEMWESGSIDSIERDTLLLSLILAVDKVSNMPGHHNGYYREWGANTNKDLVLTVPRIEICENNHKVWSADIFELTDSLEEKYDIAYIDPPYGTSNKSVSISTVGRYTTFYHLWNTLVTNNRPKVWGMANKPIEIKGKTFPLEMNIKAVVIPKFIRLIEEIKAKTVIFSYSNQGLLTPQDFEKVFEWGGCDMSSFTLYRTRHKINIQSKGARKNGEYINRESKENILFEYLFVANKREDHTRTTVVGDSHKEYEDISVVNKWLLNAENRDYLPVRTFTFIDNRFLSLSQEMGKEEIPVLSLEELLGL